MKLDTNEFAVTYITGTQDMTLSGIWIANEMVNGSLSLSLTTTHARDNLKECLMNEKTKFTGGLYGGLINPQKITLYDCPLSTGFYNMKLNQNAAVFDGFQDTPRVESEHAGMKEGTCQVIVGKAAESLLTEISVRSGIYIDSLGVRYENGNTLKAGGKGGSEHLIDVSQDEVVSLRLKTGWLIDNIEFKLASGKKMLFGGHGGGQHTTLTVPDGFRLVGFTVYIQEKTGYLHGLSLISQRK
jgi:hypothetical protein